MDVLLVRDRVADIDPHAEANATIRGLAVVELWYTGLYLDREADGGQYAGELHHQGVARRIVDLPAVALECGVDQGTAQPRQPRIGPDVILADQTAVARHV